MTRKSTTPKRGMTEFELVFVDQEGGQKRATVMGWKAAKTTCKTYRRDNPNCQAIMAVARF